MNTVDALIRDGLPESVLQAAKSEVWIAIRTDGLPGSAIIGDGTRDNPWDGSTATKLDSILNTFIVVENVTIHLGPGVFRTGGSVGVTTLYSRWQPFSGWKIIGSGKYQTTVLLTIYGQSSFNAGGQYGFWIIHSGDRFLDGFELSDLTLDCGMDDQPMPPNAQRSWPQVMCAGFVLAGRNIAVRRVRVVNFGTRAPVWVNGFPTGGYESYPGIFEPIISTPDWLTTADVSFNQLLEDCVFEQPFHSNGREVTPFHSSGRALPIGATHAFAMRRCYFNMDFVNRLPYPPTKIASIAAPVINPDGTATVTITTTGPHNVKANSLPGNIPKPFFVEISGASNAKYNDRFPVISPDTNDGSSRAQPPRALASGQRSKFAGSFEYEPETA